MEATGNGSDRTGADVVPLRTGDTGTQEGRDNDADWRLVFYLSADMVDMTDALMPMNADGEQSGIYRAIVARLSDFAELLGALSRDDQDDRQIILDRMRWSGPR